MDNTLEIGWIDSLIDSIKERGSKSGFLRIDICLIFILEIIRFEIITSGKMTDLTAGAFSQLFTFQVHEFFYRDYPIL